MAVMNKNKFIFLNIIYITKLNKNAFYNNIPNIINIKLIINCFLFRQKLPLFSLALFLSPLLSSSSVISLSISSQPDLSFFNTHCFLLG